MEFRVLGPLEVRDGDRAVAIGGGRRRALLALLLLHRNEVVPAEQLIDALWDGDPPPSAAKGLQVHVSHLRKELRAASGDHSPALVTQPPGYVLQVDPQSIDTVRFENAVHDAGRARDDGRPANAASRLRDALALWRGPPLMDFAYEGFARDEIARLEELHLLALEERVDTELALGRHRQVLAECEQLVADHPSCERLRGLFMVALYRSGRRADALDVYRDGRARSIDELGIELGPELRALEQAVLTDDDVLAAPPRDPRQPSSRVALLLLGAAVLLAAAAVAAFVLEDRDGGRPARAALDLVGDSAAALGADGRPAFVVPLPGRPAGIVAQGDQLYAVTTSAPALMIADARTSRLTRTVRLPLQPAALAVRGQALWVADGRRGLAVRLDAADARVVARATWPPDRRPIPAGVMPVDPTAIVLAGGSAWVADGSRMLVRIGESGRVRRSRLALPADGLAAGADAVWAFTRRRSAVMRVDPRTARVTDVVPVAGRPGADAPEPSAIAAAGSTVWVLSANTATLSRIDARTRAVVATIRLNADLSPRDIAAAPGVVWVACLDGSVLRIVERNLAVRTSFVRGTLVGVAASSRRSWVVASRAAR